MDFERIRKHGGYVYYWILMNSLKPQHGRLSYIQNTQGDCKLFRLKGLSYSFHKEPMGKGNPEVINPKNPKSEYPPPDSINEAILKTLCSRKKK